jgi:hypothetical protein
MIIISFLILLFQDKKICLRNRKWPLLKKKSSHFQQKLFLRIVMSPTEALYLICVSLWHYVMFQLIRIMIVRSHYGCFFCYIFNKWKKKYILYMKINLYKYLKVYKRRIKCKKQIEKSFFDQQKYKFQKSREKTGSQKIYLP